MKPGEDWSFFGGATSGASAGLDFDALSRASAAPYQPPYWVVSPAEYEVLKRFYAADAGALAPELRALRGEKP